MGSPRSEAAADHWWSEDDGSLRGDRGQYEATTGTDLNLAANLADVDALVIYSDESDRPQLALLLDEVETGWRIVGYEACR